MLSTSITSQISAEELTGVANIVQSETFRSFEVYLLLGGIYLALSFGFRLIFWVVGKLCFTRTRVIGASS